MGIYSYKMTYQYRSPSHAAGQGTHDLSLHMQGMLGLVLGSHVMLDRDADEDFDVQVCVNDTRCDADFQRSTGTAVRSSTVGVENRRAAPQ